VILLAGAVIGLISGTQNYLLPVISGAVGLVGIPLSLYYFSLLRKPPRRRE